MADLSSFAQTVSNAGATVATLPANYLKHVISQSDAGREIIVKVAKTDMTDAELNTIIKYLTTSHGSAGTGDSAFTVAAVGTADGSAFVSGTTDVVFLRMQGTGDYTVDSSDAHGVTGAVTTIEAVFQPAK
jgi:uncharacterized protein (AIM24 family)